VTASSVAELLGLAALVAGAALFDYRAGLIVLGLVLILIGWALDRGDTA
jgi:hypothetical protein